MPFLLILRKLYQINKFSIEYENAEITGWFDSKIQYDMMTFF